MASERPSGSCSDHERRLSVQRDSLQQIYPRDSSNLEMDILPDNHQTSRPQAFSDLDGDSDPITVDQRPHSRSLRPEDTISAHQPSVEVGAASEAPLAPAGDNRDEASQTDAATPAGEDPPDPYARLLKHQADILRRQVETPQRSYAFWTMYRYATKLDIAIIIISALASVASGAAMPLMTIIFGGLQGTFQDYMFLETISYSQFEDEIARFVLYFVYLAIGIFFATYISTVGFIYTGEHITTNLRQRYLESCLRQNIGFFDKFGAGEVAVKITSDANRIQDGISEKVGLLISSIATVLTGFLIGFVLTWKLTLIMCSVIIALLLNTAIWTICIVKYAMPMAIAAAKASGLTQEIFSAIRVAIAFGSQTRLVQQYDTHLKASQGAGFRMKAAIGMMMAVVMGMMHLIYGLGFWQGSVFLARDEIGIEKMLTALMAVMVGSLTVASIGPYFQAFTDAASTVSHLMFVIDRETPLDGTDTETGDKPEHVEGHLRLQNVQHIYPSRPDVTVMDNVTLDFDAGRVTALVGASGSGKSTIVGLIERFYDPVQGQVYLDGRDISTLNLQWLRQQVGLVGQEPNLFAGTVYENISYGLIGSKHEHADSAAQRELIVTAARQANAHDFISQLSDGYETDIGQRGLLLSGGQKQRIAIARAIVSNPKILLLDEATSALDTKSEGIVQAALDQASKGRTTITIAHRISTVRDAYKIIVMSQGRVVEQGDHQQLLRMRGAYFDLISAQQFNERETVLPHELEVGEAGAKVEGELSSNSTNKTRHGGVKEDVDQPTPPSESSGMLVTADQVQQAADAEKETYRLWTLIKFVATFSKQETGLVVVALLFCIICGLATPVQSVFFAKQLITLSSIGVPGQDTGEARSESDFWSLMFLMLGLVTLIAHGIQGVAFAYTAEALLRRLRSKTLSYMLRQDVSFFDRNGNSPSSLTATIAVETTQLTTMGGTALGNILVSLTTVVGGISLSLAIGWKLALVCLSVVPLLVACSIVRFYVLYKYTDRASRLYVASAAYASENISAMRTVASLTLEKLVADKYGDDLHRQRKQSLLSVSKSAALYAASQSFIFLCLGLAFWYGSTLLATYEYDIFQFFVCLMSVIFGAQSAGSLLTFIPDLVKARHSAAYLKQLFDTKPKIDTWDDTQGKRLLHMEGRLEFQSVHFRYPTRPERPVLQGLNLLLEPGKHAALVGASGCGKSTTIALLERFYDPNGGKILIDGEDITQIQINSYRNHVALVSQEPALFEGSIRDNICMGHAGKAEDVPDRVIEEACRDAAIYDFIVSLPEGFNTDIGSAGSLLSGGQKQRIAIARAMVRSPKILLLDEATSALDSESELLVQTALERAAKGRTTLTVAHRLTTIQNADVIYVIDQGRVIESGTHQDLMDRNGRYTELVKLQSFE